MTMNARALIASRMGEMQIAIAELQATIDGLTKERDALKADNEKLAQVATPTKPHRLHPEFGGVREFAAGECIDESGFGAGAGSTGAA